MSTTGPPAGLGKQKPQEKPQEHSVTVLEAGGTGAQRGKAQQGGSLGQGRRDTGSHPSSTALTRGPAHQEPIGKAQSQHEPQHAGHQSKGHPQSRCPREEGKTQVLGDHLLRAKPQTCSPLLPAPQFSGTRSPSAPSQAAVLHSTRREGRSWKTVVQLPHLPHPRPGQTIKSKVNSTFIMLPFLGPGFRK